MVRGDAIVSDLAASKPKRVRGAASELGKYSIRLEGIWVVSQSARPAATGDSPAPFAEQRARRRHRALAKSLSPTMGIFVGVSRKRPASAHHWLDLVRAQIPVGAMSVGEIAQITAAFVVVLAPLNWLVDNYSGLADCLSSGNRVAKDQLRSARAPEYNSDPIQLFDTAIHSRSGR